MLPWESRQARLLKRARRRTDLAAWSNWKTRALLAFSTLGFSLPDLTITGEAGPRAAWGGTLDVSAYLQNIGASTITEPLSQLPTTHGPTPGSPYGSTSTADAPDSTVASSITRTPSLPRARSRWGRSRLRRFHRTASNSSPTRSRCRRARAVFREPAASSMSGFVAEFANNSAGSHQGQQPEQAGRGAGDAASRCPSCGPIALAVPSSLAPGDTIVPRSRSKTSARPIPTCKGRSPSTWWPRSPRASRWEARSSRPTRSTASRRSRRRRRGELQDVCQADLNQPQNVVTITGCRRHAADESGDVLPGRGGRSQRNDQPAQPAEEQLQPIHVVGPRPSSCRRPES